MSDRPLNKTRREDVVQKMTPQVEKMLAYAKAHRNDPLPERTNVLSAYDHPTIRPGREMANSAERVVLCSPEKPCRVCQQRQQGV